MDKLTAIAEQIFVERINNRQHWAHEFGGWYWSDNKFYDESGYLRASTVYIYLHSEGEGFVDAGGAVSDFYAVPNGDNDDTNIHHALAVRDI